MEAPSGQQTLHEFFSPSKAQRVWRLILAILLTALIIGAAYEFSKPQPEPSRMTYSSSSDTFSYIDIQLLSGWVYDVTGDEDYTLYEVMDPDANWFLISLDDATYQSLNPYTEAYNAYFSANPQDYEYPVPTRLTGMPSYLSSDDTSKLAGYYDLTAEEFQQLFGSYYFNEGASNAMEYAVMYMTFGVIVGLFFLAVVLQISATQKHRKKSEDRLYQLGLLDEAESQLSDPGTRRYDKIRLALSNDYAFVGTNGYILPYTDIAWLYKRTQRNHGITIATQLVAGTIFGKTVYLAPRLATDEFITTVAQKVLAKNPNCIIGYTFEQARLYRQRVKEYKASNPK